MKTNQLRSLAAVGVLWLTLGVGCRKDAVPSTPVSCRDGTCCGPVGIHYQYVETYENELVVLSGPQGGWFLVFNKPIPTGTDEKWKTAAQVCDLTVDKAIKMRLANTNDSLIKYRVWGRLYIGDEYQQIAHVGLPRFFAIDRIEVAK